MWNGLWPAESAEVAVLVLIIAAANYQPPVVDATSTTPEQVLFMRCEIDIDCGEEGVLECAQYRRYAEKENQN